MEEKEIKKKLKELGKDWIYGLYLTIGNSEIECYITSLKIADNFLISSYTEEEGNNNMTIRIPNQDIKSISIKDDGLPFMPHIYIVVK